jgi:hypothetical protein
LIPAVRPRISPLSWWATDTLTYRGEREELNALHAGIGAIGVNVVSREANVGTSRAKTFANAQTAIGLLRQER